MELIKVGKNTYYIKNNTNIGIYKVNEKEIYLIDTGNDKEAGKKILKIIDEQGFIVKGIINTHSNADHIGGNKIIQDRTNCLILSNEIETSFIKYPELETSFLYGGYPYKDLRNKFLMAAKSEVIGINNNLPSGLEYFNLKGHFFDMIGIKTDDEIYFLADSIFSEETISKYHVFFIYDVKEFLNTLDYLETLKGKMFVPSHIEASEDIKEIININRNKIKEITNYILEICNEKITFEEILRKIFNKYELLMNSNQYILVGSTIRSYLSYLYDNNRIIYIFDSNIMYWESVK